MAPGCTRTEETMIASLSQDVIVCEQTCSKVVDRKGLPAVSTSRTLQGCTKRCTHDTEHHQVLLQHLPSQPLFCLSMGYAWQPLCTL